MRQLELEDALRVARTNVSNLQRVVRQREETLQRCRAECDHLEASIRTVQGALLLEDPVLLPPSSGRAEHRDTAAQLLDSPEEDPDSSEPDPRQVAQDDVAAGVALMISALACAAGAWVLAAPALLMFGYILLVAGANFLWDGRRLSV